MEGTTQAPFKRKCDVISICSLVLNYKVKKCKLLLTVMCTENAAPHHPPASFNSESTGLTHDGNYSVPSPAFSCFPHAGQSVHFWCNGKYFDVHLLTVIHIMPQSPFSLYQDNEYSSIF